MHAIVELFKNKKKPSKKTKRFFFQDSKKKFIFKNINKYFFYQKLNKIKTKAGAESLGSRNGELLATDLNAKYLKS